MILNATVDTKAVQIAPSTNYGANARLGVNGGGASDAVQSFVYFPRPFPAGATILTAKLRLRIAGTWSGTNDLTVKRIISRWAESTLTWNLRPSVSATHAATASVVAGVDRDVVEFDVVSILQDVSAGGAYVGFRVELTQHAGRLFYSSESGTVSLRPTLELTWSEAPETPDRLGPDGSLAVSSEFPVLSWHFADKSGNTSQASAQVQLMQGSDDFSSPDYDTTKIAHTESQWDSDDTVFGGVDDGETWYWRVKVWDGTDFESEWSEPAVFVRTDLGSLTVDSPGATAAETTPPIEWTLTGTTQESYRVTLYRINANLTLTQLWQVADVDAATIAVTPATNLIKTGENYRVTVEVWDDVDRYGDDHLTTSQDFTYVLDGSPDPVDSLTASTLSDGDGFVSPAVQLDWSRASAPDLWCLVVDGVEVLDDIDLSDTFLSGDDYRLIYWGADPRVEHTYEIRAVVSGVGMSEDNPEVTMTVNPVGIWIADDAVPASETPLMVCIYGQDDADLTIGETGTTYTPIGSQSPVRIIDTIRGYEGGVSGVLLSQDARDDFLAMKALDSDLRLVIGDLSFPIRMEEAHCAPTPHPGDTEFTVAFGFFQSGPPWPIAQ